MSRYTFELWTNEDGTQQAFWPRESIDSNHPAFSDMVRLVFSIEAATYEEAMAACHIRRGFAPYKPEGIAAECPNHCGAHYYPDGSAECPLCGKL